MKLRLKIISHLKYSDIDNFYAKNLHSINQLNFKVTWVWYNMK